MPIEVTALDHLYLTVRDLAVSQAFYDPVMRLLDFRKGTKPIGGDPHVHYFNRVMQISLRPAREAAAHDPYAPGLHHLCLRVATREDVDAVARELRGLGVQATPPALWPEYAEDYYATFFEDPDGIRLEVVAERALRRLVRERWAELTAFEDPVAKAGLLR
jgi:catechol 2,3-dioxygenase-like lactoylglutathione lyase family enzyme